MEKTETTKESKSSKTRKEQNYTAIAWYAGRLFLEGALVSLGGFVMQRGLQSLTSPKLKTLSNENNIIPFSKAMN